MIAVPTTSTGRRIFAIAAAASLALAVVAPAAASKPIIVGPGGIPPTTTTVTVTKANSGGTVNIPQNGVLRIVLPYNPSTGFQWVCLLYTSDAADE